MCVCVPKLYSPTHILPMMRQPAMEAWTTGMVSDNSPSNTLQSHRQQHDVTYFSSEWKTITDQLDQLFVLGPKKKSEFIEVARRLLQLCSKLLMVVLCGMGQIKTLRFCLHVGSSPCRIIKQVAVILRMCSVMLVLVHTLVYEEGNFNLLDF